MLVGLYPYVAVTFRQALEGLVAAYVADTHQDFTNISNPLQRWRTMFREFERAGFKNIVDRYFSNDKDLADEISSLWKELSYFFCTCWRSFIYIPGGIVDCYGITISSLCRRRQGTIINT